MSIISEITNILKEVPISAVLRERLVEAEAKMTGLEKENASLKAENANLRMDLTKARDEIQRHNEILKREFTPHRGALFKRKAGGGYLNEVFCRKCHNPMVSFHHPYRCASCNVTVNFEREDLFVILAELPKVKE